MKTIDISTPKHPSTFVIVDDEDFEAFNVFKWHAFKNGRSVYAKRHDPNNHKTLLWMHRLILKTPPHLFVDHIDGNGLNNQRSNLRNCTIQQNGFNRKKDARQKPASSIHVGVSFEQKRRRFNASIRIDGVLIRLGSFKNETDAVIARNAAAKKYFGDFAKLNIVEVA